MSRRFLGLNTTFFLSILFVCGGVFAADKEPSETVTVAVASNFLIPMKVIVEDFEKTTGHKVVLVPGSSGKLYTQIRSGAPYDLFLSADSIPMGLAVTGQMEFHSIYTYALGRLALWSPLEAEDTETMMPEALAGVSKNNRLAIANPNVAPYGTAAIEVIKKLGLSERIAPHLVRGQSVAQAYHFVESGAAGLGLVAVSQIQEKGLRGRAWKVPDYLHEEIRQDLALLKNAEGNSAAIALYQWLASTDAREIIKDFGYDLEPLNINVDPYSEPAWH